jgi:CheY-like chemotaxis protein
LSGADGNIICSQIKAQEDLRLIPVIIFSANKNTEQIAFDCGANGYLAKPFDLKDLLNITREKTGFSVA